jgi:hypothetical protein
LLSFLTTHLPLTLACRCYYIGGLAPPAPPTATTTAASDASGGQAEEQEVGKDGDGDGDRVGGRSVKEEGTVGRADALDLVFAVDCTGSMASYIR